MAYRVMRGLSKSLANSVLPNYLVDALAAELRLSFRRILAHGSVRRSLAQVKACRVNIGCGGRPTPGWINLDVYSAPGVHFWDCRRGLPFADNAVTAIYSEHVFEHFDPESEAQPFLRECLRCLQEGGVLRLVVPDAGAYLRAYPGPWADLQKLRSLESVEGGWRDYWLDKVYVTKMELVNAVFRQDYGHKYAYDAETLELALRRAGFQKVIVQAFDRSVDPEMVADFELRKPESLYMEAVK